MYQDWIHRRVTTPYETINSTPNASIIIITQWSSILINICESNHHSFQQGFSYTRCIWTHPAISTSLQHLWDPSQKPFWKISSFHTQTGFFITKYILCTCVYVNCSEPVFVLNPMLCITEYQAVSYSDLPPAHDSALKIHQLTCTSIMHGLSEPIKACKILISIDVNMNGMYCFIQLVNQ